MKNEETRATNANSRGVTLLSATSLVTAIIGFFAKDLFDAGVSSAERRIGVLGFIVVIALLITTAGFLVFGVLFPTQRELFGDNAITHHDVDLDLMTVLRIEISEFESITSSLRNLTAHKMKWLKRAYLLFFVTVSAIGITASLVIGLRW